MFTIDQILSATNGKLISGDHQGLVRSISIDSRAVIKGQLFIAIKGEIFDGHEFVKDVIAKGVRVILVHQPIVIDDPKISVILVKDTVRALGDLARFHRLRFKAPVIALTGSAGKTTTKEMIAGVLSRKYKVLKNEGTQNNHIGVPMTLLKLKPAHQMVILECGTNQPGDIPWLADVARPDLAVFTNIGEGHLAKLRTPEGVLKEKWALTAFMSKDSTVIINADDKYLSKHRICRKAGFNIITYGIKKKSDFLADRIRIDGGRRLRFSIGRIQIELNSCGTNNIYNALAAFACGHLFKVSSADIALALKRFEFPQGRGQILRLGSGWLINDVYNANPVSMRSALQTLDALNVDGKKIFVAADMLELGVRARELHKAIGQAAGLSSVNVVISVGQLSRLIASESKKRNKEMQAFSCKDIEEAQQCLSKVFRNGDAVLVKGSRRMKMEAVVEFLLASPRASLS